MTLSAQSNKFHAFEWLRATALQGHRHAVVLLEELVRLKENNMEELIQALASEGRMIKIEYTGDRLLRATVCGKVESKPGQGEVRTELVIRESTTVAYALRDCATALMHGRK